MNLSISTKILSYHLPYFTFSGMRYFFLMGLKPDKIFIVTSLTIYKTVLMLLKFKQACFLKVKVLIIYIL